jgi:hypothetical protein
MVARATTDGHADDRLVILMDATVPKAIYDPDNVRRSRFNADELVEVLKDDSPPLLLVREPVVDYEWDRDEFIARLRPYLVVIHRSSFYHALAAKMGWLYPTGSETKEDLKGFEERYDIADDKLIRFIGTVGRSVSQTHFLVYSRGTDKRWLNKAYREQWVKNIERRFPELRERIWLMVIPEKPRDTFRHPETAANMRTNVLNILGLPEKRD